MVTTTPNHDFAVSSAPPVRKAGLRDPRLDFYRGIAMFIILIAHTPRNWWTGWIPARFGFSDATEIFVFCSGMASAIAFGKVFAERGWMMGTTRTVYRIWQVYWAHIGLFFFIAMMLAALEYYGNFEKSYVNTLNLWPFFRDPMPQLVGLFTLTYVPNYFDVLPMYLVILMMMPLMMALAKVHVWLALGTSVGIWFMANLGWLALPAEPWSDRQWFFNPFGWQLVFFTGFAFMRGWLPKPPVSTTLVIICAGFLVLSAPFASWKVVNWLAIPMPELAEWLKDLRPGLRDFRTKTEFGILRYLHFLSLAYIFWVAAGEGGWRLRETSAGFMGQLWASTVTVVSKVGQQSLAVFVFSMALARFMGFILDQVGRTGTTVALVNLAGLATIVGVAYTAAFFKSSPWKRKPA
ncbi:MAG: OpgC domain-containing protein [Pseudomonadota bacterium]